MKEEIFQDCLSKWSQNEGNSAFWDELAEKWGIKTGEKLRWQFKSERKRRGIKKTENKITKTNAKILCFDVETTPMMALTWGIWEQNIHPEAVLQEWHILSWAAKWLFDDEIMSDILTPKEAKNHDDKRIVKSMWNLLNEADVVVSHNGDKFDLKKLNTRFLIHNFPPPKAYQSIDTLNVARNTFAFTSNKLDAINAFLGLPAKTHTGFELWKKCYFGDPEALNEMLEYNKNDCNILEDLYLRLRSYIKSHPNLNLFSEDNISICPNCGSANLDWKGFYYTYTGKYKSFRCNDCGAIGRSRHLEMTKEKRKTVVR